MKPQANLPAVHVLTFSADISGGEERGKMQAIEADNLLATTAVGLPAELEEQRIGLEWDDTVIVLIVVVPENPAANWRAERRLLDPFDQGPGRVKGEFVVCHGKYVGGALIWKLLRRAHMNLKMITTS